MLQSSPVALFSPPIWGVICTDPLHFRAMHRRTAVPSFLRVIVRLASGLSLRQDRCSIRPQLDLKLPSPPRRCRLSCPKPHHKPNCGPAWFGVFTADRHWRPYERTHALPTRCGVWFCNPWGVPKLRNAADFVVAFSSTPPSEHGPTANDRVPFQGLL